MFHLSKKRTSFSNTSQQNKPLLRPFYGTLERFFGTAALSEIQGDRCEPFNNSLYKNMIKRRWMGHGLRSVSALPRQRIYDNLLPSYLLDHVNDEREYTTKYELQVSSASRRKEKGTLGIAGFWLTNPLGLFREGRMRAFFSQSPSQEEGGREVK